MPYADCCAMSIVYLSIFFLFLHGSLNLSAGECYMLKLVDSIGSSIPWVLGCRTEKGGA